MLVLLLVACAGWFVHPRLAPYAFPALVNNRPIEVEVISDYPRVVLLHNFLSKSEAHALIADNDRHLTRSLVLVDSPQNQVTDYRTSSSTTITSNDINQQILQRCLPFTPMPKSHFEPFQLVRYRPGEEFKKHSDCFSNLQGAASQRFETFFIYLSTLEPDQGGCTVFPNLSLKFQPKLGTAVHWMNLDSDGNPSSLLDHYGEKVHYGVKYSVNVWTRTKPFHGH